VDENSDGTIVITGPLIGDQQVRFPDNYEVIYSDKKVMDQEEFNDIVRDACAAIVMTNLRVDKELIDSAPKLKILSNFGVGYDNIDVKYAREKQVMVTNTPDVLTLSCAELGVALVMMTARKVVEGCQLIESGGFKGWEVDLLLGTELRGKTFGILGCGRIGQAMARIVSGFGMEMIYHNRRKLKSGIEVQLGIRYVDFQSLITDSDILVITCPLNDQNRHSFNFETFELMKKSSILVNVGRGGIIKESDLVLALREDLIGGVGLDVFENPANIPVELRLDPRVTLTPHIGSATREAREAMSALSVQAVLDVISGLKPQYMLK
jgi:lactate dehydrogenase-like 2-hydroxyacid dehydrogenase